MKSRENEGGLSERKNSQGCECGVENIEIDKIDWNPNYTPFDEPMEIDVNNMNCT